MITVKRFIAIVMIAAGLGVIASLIKSLLSEQS